MHRLLVEETLNLLVIRLLACLAEQMAPLFPYTKLWVDVRSDCIADRKLATPLSLGGCTVAAFLTSAKKVPLDVVDGSHSNVCSLGTGDSSVYSAKTNIFQCVHAIM